MMNNTEIAKLDKILSKVGDLGFKRRIKILLDWLDIQPEDKVLDCGCGEGFYSMILANIYPETQVIAFDFNAELLAKADTWVGPREKVTFMNGNIEEGLPFADGQFNKIIFTEVLEHLDDDTKALKDIYRVLAPGGVVSLTVPNANYPMFWDPLNWVREKVGAGHFDAKNTVLGGVWSYDHKRLYSVEHISSLAKATGFQVKDTKNITHYCMPFNYHVLRLGKLFYTNIPVSEEVKASMEKFMWDEATPKENWQSKMINGVFDLFKKVDSKNDKLNDLSKSSVCVGLKLTK